MRSAVVPAAGLSGVPGIQHAWAGFRGVDRAIVLDRVVDLLGTGSFLLSPPDLFTAICEAMGPYLALTNVVLFKRIAGQSRTLAWSAPGASTLHPSAHVATVSVADVGLGLSALLHVESRRRLEQGDRGLLGEVLRRMLGLPLGAEER